MRALDRKLLRDLGRLWAQSLAIALVIAAGVATAVMAFGMLRSLEATREAYYERYRFAQVFAGLKRAPESLAGRIARIPGVARVDARIVETVTLDIPGLAEPAVGRVISVPEGAQPPLDRIALRAGRLPAAGRPDEAVLGEAAALALGLGPGDHLSALLNGRKRRLSIVGIGLSPEYVYALGPGQIIPDDRHFAVLWMGRKALEAAFDLDGAFDDVALTLSHGASAPEVIRRLDLLLAPYGGLGAYGRADQVSHAFLDGELEGLRGTGRIIPPIFLAVAAFLLNIVVARLIETERGQIGLLKAFGYSDRAIGWHYAKFVLLLTLGGVALGFAGGAWLGQAMAELYARYFRFPFLEYRLDLGVFALAAAVSLAAAMAGTAGAVRRAVRLAPAEAMQPAPPVAYRRSALERIGLVLGGRAMRMILRHLLRWPRRTLSTVAGLAAASAVLVGALFGFDSMERIIDTHFFLANRQDATVVFVEPQARRALLEIARLPGVLAAEPFRTVAARLRHGHLSERTGIRGLVPDAELSRMIDAELRPLVLPGEGLALSTKLARLLRVGRGERVTVEALEGRRPVVRLPVTAVVEDYVGVSAYMDLGALGRMMRETGRLSGAHISIDSRRAEALYARLKAMPAVASVTLTTAALAAFRETVQKTMTTMLLVYVLFGGVIAFGVVYNAARISLSERARDLATLRMLGYTRGQAAAILLGELALLAGLSLPLGCAAGYGLAAVVSAGLDSELYRVPLVVTGATYGTAILTVLGAAVLSGLVVRRRIDRLDMVETLKSRD